MLEKVAVATFVTRECLSCPDHLYTYHDELTFAKVCKYGRASLSNVEVETQLLLVLDSSLGLAVHWGRITLFSSR